MSEESGACPYCEKYDCNHLLAHYDETFNELQGGYFDKVNEHDKKMVGFFNEYLNEFDFTDSLKGINNSELGYVWDDIYADRMSVDFNEETETYDVDSICPNSNRFIFTLLEDICYPEYTEFEGGPGQSSSYKVFYSEDVEKTYKDFLVHLTKTLESYMANARSSAKKLKKR
jgi:hypothetical protein